MPCFEYKAKNVYYTEIGSGKPLLLLHGNTASSNMFLSIAPLYAENYKVVLVDFLGHGKSDRLDVFPTDLWYDEAQQVITLLREKDYVGADLIGTSGGALVAINAALEAPELIGKVIADSFEGEVPLKEVTENLAAGRETSKRDEGARAFYRAMHGNRWEHVVDCDTDAVLRHQKERGRFFHRELRELRADILLTGSRQDEFMAALSPDDLERTYGELLEKIGHGEMHLFDTGGHPAMLSNQAKFVSLSQNFFERRNEG
ncbi:MAG: alpha/beta hydrolase [Oscillospiraceae bacterium]|nr:alpha/beta hydrolase [Oscillospiraceae bacterium]